MAVREVLGMGDNACAVARLVDLVLALTALVLALVLVRGVGELDGTYEK